MTIAAKSITAEELLEKPDADHLELVEGELIEVSPANARHGDIAGQIAMLLKQYVNPRKLGKVLVEGGFILRRHPDTVLGPDVSFIAASRIPASGLPESFFDGHPDLAVEIISPRNLRRDLDGKIRRYLAAGTAICWLVNPGSRSVEIFRSDAAAAAPEILTESQTITGENTIPGFSVSVSEFFA